MVVERTQGALVTGSAHSHSRTVARTIPIAWVQLAVILAAVAVAPIFKTVDPDFWWHLATGERILDSGIPQHDPFSWTAAGKGWVAHEWLSEAIMALIQRAGGYAANVVVFDAVAIGALVLMYALGRKLGAHPRLLVLLSVLSVASFLLFVTPRPQAFSWLLFAAFVYVLTLRDRGDDVPAWALAPATAVWANLHLGFVFGVALAGLWLGANILRWFARRPARLREPAMLFAGCAAFACLNPHGPAAFLYPLEYMEDRESLAVIAEWRSPLSPINFFLIPYYISVVVLAAAALRGRLSIFALLVTGFAIAVSLTTSRNVPFAALVLMPYAGAAFSGGTAEPRTTRIRASVAVAAMTVAIVGLMIAGFQSQGRFQFRSDPPHEEYPEAGAAYLREHPVSGGFYNEYNWGGYLIHEVPEVPVFIDGRSDFYGDVFADYITIGRLEPGWDELIEQYGIHVMLLRKEARLAHRLREDRQWREVFTGPIESVFVRE